MSMNRPLAFLILALAAFGSTASDADQGVLLIGVDAIQLNNRQDPTGYAAALLEFKVKNLETGKRYAKPPSSDRYPSILKLPSGTYCLYSVSTYINQELTYCKQPYFSIKAGRINNVGKWRFGVSYEAGTFRLMHAFEAQEETAQQAREHYPSQFTDEQTDGKKD